MCGAKSIHLFHVGILNVLQVSLDQREALAVPHVGNNARMVHSGLETHEQVHKEQGVGIQVEGRRTVEVLSVGDLADCLFELGVVPSRRVLHHRCDGVVVLIRSRVQKRELGPVATILTSALKLADVDALLVDLEVVHQLLGSVLGVLNAQLSENTHVSTVEIGAVLKKLNQLVE